MLLYHGTSLEAAKSILSKQSFDLTKCGEGWGSTYGDGIYLTPNLEDAKMYGEKVLKISCNINPYRLEKRYSPTDRRHKKQIRRLIINCIKEGDFDSLISVDGDEYILFEPEKSILKIE